MKRILLLIAMFLSVSFSSSALTQDMRGVWISSVYNLDFPSAPGLSAEQLKAEADNIIEKVKASGLTDIFLQVRPTCDALYKSDIFPSSAYVCTTQGDNFPDDFDILQYFIDKGTESGINIHAWINPYRITRGGFSSKEEAMEALSADNPARALADDVIFHTDGNLYFDPSSEKARQLIIDGALELVNNYDIAGIHLDDYFYPSSDFADDKSYQSLKLENEDLHSFRVRQVDSLIYSLYDAIKSADPDCLFGVSPFGVWANKSNNENGSDTHSSQSYYDHYADTLKWVREEKLDYIMPQLYWNIGNTEADYSILLKWWEETVEGTSVKLYTGNAAYRIADGELGYTVDEISAQLKLNITSENCSGFCLFRLGSIDDSLTERLSAFTDDSAIYIAIENDNFQTTLPRFHFYGTAKKSLSINGQPVEISAGGYFSISKPLVYGANEFIFTSGNNLRKVNIFRKYTLNNAVNGYNFTLPCDTGLITAVFSACKANGSFFGCFYPENILKEYNDENIFSLSVTNDASNIYLTPTTDNGAISVLPAGIRWNVTASKGEFFCLENLGWIKKENCKVLTKSVRADGRITDISPIDNDYAVTIRFEHSDNIDYSLTESENGYSIHVIGISNLPELPEIIGNGSTVITSCGLVYTFTPSLNTDISGYDILSYDGYTDIIFYKKTFSDDSSLPLAGIAFLLDAGHGGSQMGALSCSPNILEKDINLDYTLALGEKLSALGAEVKYTRTEDTDISLDERYNMTFGVNGVFISIHSDSISNSSVNTNMSGVSLHVNNRHSDLLADFIFDNVGDIPANYISHNSNLYMAKPKNLYSILIENQFVSSPPSLELLLSEEYKARFIDSLSNALCKFFAK